MKATTLETRVSGSNCLPQKGKHDHCMFTSHCANILCRKERESDRNARQNQRCALLSGCATSSSKYILAYRKRSHSVDSAVRSATKKTKGFVLDEKTLDEVNDSITFNPWTYLIGSCDIYLD